jgi:hypothetical protein
LKSAWTDLVPPLGFTIVLAFGYLFYLQPFFSIPISLRVLVKRPCAQPCHHQQHHHHHHPSSSAAAAAAAAASAHHQHHEEE